MGRNSILVAGSTIRLTPGAATGSSSLPGRYRVRPGDTLSGIAARFGIGLHRVARANGLRVNSGLLLAGITMRVPSGTAAQRRPSPPGRGR